MSFTITSQYIAGTAIAMFAKISYYDFLFDFSVTGQMGKVWGTKKWNNMLIKIVAAGKNYVDEIAHIYFPLRKVQFSRSLPF